ncbi:MAG: FAD-dependent oxidoreductase [Gammaproteobacteria bacterium]|nr:FAD-dependent oxidoreductase [Gammaproteobacteria bacterium]
MMPVTGEIAFQLARLSETDLRAAITTLYSDVYGAPALAPTNIISFRWGLNPLFMGSYSNVFPRGIGGFTEMARPEGRMYIAGEGTSTRYQGFMHGSYLSGIETVNTIRGLSSGTKLMGNSMLVLVIAICKIMF